MKYLRREFRLTITQDEEYGKVNPQFCFQQYNYNVEILVSDT